MKFFYQLERYEEGEYVIVKLEENGHEGIGAVLPDRSKGQNYKTVMGAIEEYRSIVEQSKPWHFAALSQRLLKHFPGHPNVTFAISAAATELFSKLQGAAVEELLMCDGLQLPLHLENWNGEIVIPEEIGGVMEVLAIPEKRMKALLLRKYPKGEMEKLIFALSRYFAGYIIE